MNTILFEIPDKYFPGFRVRVPFRVKVRYEVVAGKVHIMELCFSPDCLRCISNVQKLSDEIQRELAAVEKKSDNAHPTVMNALKAFIG